MDQPILLEKQRQILGTLRDKTAEAVQAELAEIHLAESSEAKIRGSASAQKEQAQSQLREARDALSRGRTVVQQTLPHATGMLDLVSTHSPLHSDTAGELGRAAASAQQAISNLEQACENLQAWRSDKARQDLANQKIDEIAREKRRKRRVRIILGVAAFLLLIGLAVVLASMQSSLNRQYDDGLAMLEAKQWQEARGIFVDLGNHRDSPTMVAETYYREAADALQSGELETAREVLQRIPGYRDSYALLTEVAPTSTDIPTSTPEVTRETPPKPSPTAEDSPTPKPPSETPKEEPSEIPIPEPTSPPTKVPPSVSCDFSSKACQWTWDYSSQYAQYRIVDGQLSFEVSKSNTVRQIYLTGQSFSNFTAEVKVKQYDGASTGVYGFFFRHRDDKYCYRFTIDGNGTFEIGREYNNKWQYFPGYNGKIASSVIKKKGDWNTLKIVCQGNRIMAYVNGHEVASATDNTFSKGHLGLVAGTENGNKLSAYFDNFQVYVP